MSSFYGDYNKFSRLATEIERGFNVAGNIPVVSIVSGSLRMLVGKAQAVAGALLWAASKVGAATTADRLSKRRFALLGKFGAMHFQHGLANIFRGMVEVTLGGTFGGLGSIFMVIPNLSEPRPFDPTFKYRSL